MDLKNQTHSQKKTISNLLFTFFLLGVQVLFCATTQGSIEPKKPGTSPNVIIVFTDDQGYGDLGCHGNPWIKTPNIDHFAAQGLELTNFHVGTTCAPSRAGLMTGRNSNRNNAWHTIAGCSILLKDEETMAQVFARNGYQTAMFGKWHLGDQYPYRPQDRGFQEVICNGGGGVGQTPDYWTNDYFDDTYFHNGVPEKFHGYCTDVWFREAKNYIQNRRPDKPFFLYLPLNAAHEPYNVPEEYAKMYTSAPLTESQKRFYGMISNIDENFGDLVAYLKEKGLYDNTILIFSTDNGTSNGITHDRGTGKEIGYNAGLRGTKGSQYDGGHRVPFFVSWPNGDILKKTSSNELTAHVDMLPTLAELCGLDYIPKKPLDGTSIAKLLEGKEKTLDRMLVIDTQRDQWPVKGKNSCVMATKWRLVNGKELYNTLDDPGQKTDLSFKFPDQVQKMQAFYNDWWSRIEPDFKYAEIPLGSKKADKVYITIHDMHSTGPIPWNQKLIREGKDRPEGYYSVKVITDGTYQFRLGRYPPESGLTIDADAPDLQSTPYNDGFPVGIGIHAVQALVQMGEAEFQTDVDPDKNYAILQVQLKKGAYKMSTKFITDKGVEYPVYFNTIEKM